jgi:MFS family permease
LSSAAVADRVLTFSIGVLRLPPPILFDLSDGPLCVVIPDRHRPPFGIPGTGLLATQDYHHLMALKPVRAGILPKWATSASANRPLMGSHAPGFSPVRAHRTRLFVTTRVRPVFTFLCSFAQNFEQLFILRGLHGLGFGGECATGAVLMGEVIRDKYRGRGVGFVQTGAAVEPGLAALVYAGLYTILPEAIAWRALFAVGILPALLVLWIRRSIPESEASD